MSHRSTLFILKKFYDYGGTHQIANGLRTSAQFVVDLLLREGHRAYLAEAIDANCIDRLVTEYRPARVVLEAIWVTPTKLAELQKLHPNVSWTVRVHSELPFLANEGMAMEWLLDYIDQGVEVAFNSSQTVEDFKVLGESTYLPNFYPLRQPRRHPKHQDRELHVGCFGAIRPLKNQLIQAVAAIRYARDKGMRLVFHMNGSRVEQHGANCLKNIQAVIQELGNELVLHPWLPHNEFLELIGEMDICLQVSLSESFCIVASDAVSMGVPLIGSDTISWLPKRSKAKVDSTTSIVEAMHKAGPITVFMNHASLESYLESAAKIWNEWAC